MSFYVDSLTVEGQLTHKSWNTGVKTYTVSNSVILLFNTDESTQVFTGSVAGQVLRLPDATTFSAIGQRYTVINDSTQSLTVQDNSGTLLFALAAGFRAFVMNSDISSAAGVWRWYVVSKYSPGCDQLTVTYPGSGLAVNYTAGAVWVNGTSYIIPAGMITLPASQSNYWLYVSLAGAVAYGASVPDGTVPLYEFSTSLTAVTSLVDNRQHNALDLVWGTVTDISPVYYSQASSAGVLDRFARADHHHFSNLPLYKSGSVAAGSFTLVGTQRTAAVTFSTPFPSIPTVTITGQDGRAFIVQNITVNGFTINSQAATSLSASVQWQALLPGESQ